MGMFRMIITVVIFLFMVIAMYFLLSTPITMLFDAFANMNQGDAEELATIIPLYRTVFNMFFAVLAAIPLTYMVFWFAQRDPRGGYGSY